MPLAATPVYATVTETSTTPHPGIVHSIRIDDAIPVRIHIVEIDLSSAEIRLVSTAEDERGQTTSSWAALAGVQVAVNGDLFDPFTFAPAGLAFGGGGVWSISADTLEEGFLRFDRAMDVNHAAVEPPETMVAPADLPPATEGVVGGRPMLVRTGVAETSFACEDAVALACERAPRTAAGVSEDGLTLFLFVVDGWQLDSAGLTAGELGAVMAARGAHNAIGMDPGSSSTLWIGNEGGVVSSPSDGVEREVANHIGVAFGALPPGTLLGFVRERDVFTGANIVGATVTLDSGQTDVTAADGRYSFSGLTPRFTCATASAPGYRSATQCKTVVSSMMEFNSIPLFPNSDFIDAGPGAADAAPTTDATPRPDGAPLVDGGSGGDGGVEPPSPSACGCRVGGRFAGTGSEPGSDTGMPAAALCGLALVLALAFAWLAIVRPRRQP